MQASLNATMTALRENAAIEIVARPTAGRIAYFYRNDAGTLLSTMVIDRQAVGSVANRTGIRQLAVWQVNEVRRRIWQEPPALWRSIIDEDRSDGERSLHDLAHSAGEGPLNDNTT